MPRAAIKVQVMTQKITLQDVLPPAKTGQFELLFELERLPENAEPVHPPFKTQTVPDLIQPMRHEPLECLLMSVKEPSSLATTEINGIDVITFQQVCYLLAGCILMRVRPLITGPDNTVCMSLTRQPHLCLNTQVV